jgi:hypothetical protein
MISEMGIKSFQWLLTLIIQQRQSRLPLRSHCYASIWFNSPPLDFDNVKAYTAGPGDEPVWWDEFGWPNGYKPARIESLAVP